MTTPSPRYILVLSLAAGVILIGGWLARPHAIPTLPAPVPTETELQQLARRAERRSLASTSTFFAGLAREAELSMVRVGDAGPTGIAWSPGRLVLPPLRSSTDDRSVKVVAPSGETTGQLERQGPDASLSTVTIAGSPGVPPARRALSVPSPGAWIIAVWRADAAATFVVGNFGEARSTVCGTATAREIVASVPLTWPMIGGGLFDIDGGLLAAILPCGDRLAAITVESIDALLNRADTIDRRLLEGFGFAAAPLTDEERRHFAVTEGLVVREVWEGFAADAAGLRPGDIITAVGDGEVSEMDHLRAMVASPAAPVALTVRRRAARVKITIPGPPILPAAAAGAGLIVGTKPSTYPVEAVLPGSPAAAAGLEAGDRIVRIDQREPRTVDEVRRLVAGRRQSAWLEVIRDRRRIGMLVREGSAR